MRSIRLAQLIPVGGTGRFQSSGGYGRHVFRDQHQPRFGGPRDNRPPRSAAPHILQAAGYRDRPTEPQLVAKLLEYFPSGRSSVPVNKWASTIPEDVQEALVPYGGLAQFATSQGNFFIPRKENGMTVISLSTMALSLCTEREKNIKKREKAASFSTRRREQSKHQR
ncbi:hypothetical protein ERJ75_001530500 [Trypanosoma vivax]|uniref:Uncharacterized protein n=1 Tax=Trypanosoma vivax (strain Y486) TaxID=1055687 RepID=G0UB20_TRYVY|nr:hypothetical protein ERJ75_001530500 [Trypanosoma vivax]CCC53007.1 conserved hypothetical protein [Trypanosoma vivax Y486]